MYNRLYLFLIHGITSVLQETVYSPIFIIAVTIILILERLFPVDPKQETLSIGFLHDSVWLLMALLFVSTVVAVYVKAFTFLYNKYFSFLTVPWKGHLPQIVSFMIGVVLSDLLQWFKHWLMHKVPWLWQFHAVHHSQRQLNMFTNERFHFIEYIVSRPIVLIPMMILAVDMPNIIAFGIFSTWQVRFYHSNIKSNLGFLRHIFVTPQSHRLHHSFERQFQEKNFGIMFSFWDRIFNTQSDIINEYPDTGIKDGQFPLERKTSFLDLFIMPLRQLFYPFYAIARDFRTKGSMNRL